MTAVEIALIVIGIICIIVSLIFNFEDNNQGEDVLVSAELSETQKNRIEEQINAIVSKKMEDVKEETEASLDHVSNTKILEMNEYAENVLGEINRNHNETVFLYDMLNEKAKELKTTVKDVNNAKRQVEQIQAETIANEEPPEDVQNKRKQYAGSNNTRDVAKERLVALVKKSNERARGEDGSLRRNVQAEKLDHIVNASKDEPHMEPVMESETPDKNGKELPEQAEKKEDKPVKQEESKEKTGKSAKQKESKEKADKPAKQEESKEKADKPAKQEESIEKTDKPAKQEESKEKADKPAKQEESKEKADKPAKQEESKEKADKPAEQLPDSEKPAAKATERARTSAKKKTTKTTKTDKTDEKENSGQSTEKEVKATTTRKRTVKKKASDAAAADGNGDNKAVNVQFEKGATTNEKILKLYESGINNRDIAKMLNLGMGEVKLVIDLYKGGK